MKDALLATFWLSVFTVSTVQLWKSQVDSPSTSGEEVRVLVFFVALFSVCIAVGTLFGRVHLGSLVGLIAAFIGDRTTS